MSNLYVISTPIGNLEDVTQRALRVLGEVSLVACEDTRRSRRLLAHYAIKTPTTSYHGHNRRQKIPVILEALKNSDVALVSDGGTPVISDPGRELVAAAWAAGHCVSVVPGASAATSCGDTARTSAPQRRCRSIPADSPAQPPSVVARMR